MRPQRLQLLPERLSIRPGQGCELLVVRLHGKLLQEVEDVLLGDGVGGQEVDAVGQDTLPVGLRQGRTRVRQRRSTRGDEGGEGEREGG
jgi:hypothetical protein